MDKSEAHTASIAASLRALRERTGLSIRDVSSAIGRSTSGYVFYETTYKKKYLPLEIAEDIASVFKEYGIKPSEVLALAGAAVRQNENSALEYIMNNDVNDETQSLDHHELFAKHSSLINPGNIDDGCCYIPTANMSDYDKTNDIMDVIYPGEHVYARLWRLRRNVAGFFAGDILALDLDPDLEPRVGDFVCASALNSGIRRTIFRIFVPPVLINGHEQIAIDDSVLIHGVVMGMCRRLRS